MRDKRCGPLDEVIAELNAAWAAAGYELVEADHLTRRTVERVVEREEIRRQAEDNTEDQFVHGGSVVEAVKLALWELVQHHAGVSEYFNREGAEQQDMQRKFAQAVWRSVHGGVGPVDVGQVDAEVGTVLVDEGPANSQLGHRRQV